MNSLDPWATPSVLLHTYPERHAGAPGLHTTMQKPPSRNFAQNAGGLLSFFGHTSVQGALHDPFGYPVMHTGSG